MPERGGSPREPVELTYPKSKYSPQMDTNPQTTNDPVEDTALRPNDRAASAREPGLSGSVAGDRRADGFGGGRLYPADGAAGHAAVSGGWRAWRRLLFPVGGSLGIGYLLWRFFPNARGSGVPQTKAALFAREGHITMRTVFGKFFCTSVTLASGIPLGREGPSVQVGAGIGSVLGRMLGLSNEQVKKLVPVGAAAAIAAAFNTPLAAVVFSLEEIMGDLNAPLMGGVVLASATAWMVLRLLLGDHPLFKVPAYHLVSPAEFGVYAVLGVGRRRGFRGLHNYAAGHAGPVSAVPAKHGVVPSAGGRIAGRHDGLVCAAGVGGWLWICRRRAERKHGVRLMLVLLVLKLISVTVSYASGNAGGIFGPSLFLGAMLGGTVGTVAHHYFPASTAIAGRLRAGGDGRGVRGRGARAHDLGADHL